MFLQSNIFPIHAIRDTMYITQIKISTCFATQVQSSGIYYNKGVQAKLLIYILFIAKSLIKIPVVKIHNMYKIYKIDIVNNLQCFNNT